MPEKATKAWMPSYPFFHYVILKRLTILHGGLPRGGDNHCLGLATQFLHDGGAEMLYNDLDPLRDIGIMQLYKAGDLSLGCVGLTAGSSSISLLIW